MNLEATVPSRAAAYVLLPLVVLLWGVNWPAMKFGLAYVTPLWFATLRTGLGAACLFAVLAMNGKLVVPTRHDLPIVATIALLQIAAFQPLANFGLRHVAAGRAAVLVYTTPLWVTPAAVLVLGERLTPWKIAGLACGLLGIAALFNPFALDWSKSGVLLGSVQLMAAALLWAISILHIRLHRWRHSALQLMPWQLLLALACLLPITLYFDGGLDPDWNRTVVAVIVYNGPIATAFCYWAATLISQALPAITTSLSFLGVPAVGILASALILGEQPDATLLGGFGLILGGVALVTIADVIDRKRSSRPLGIRPAADQPRSSIESTRLG